MYCDEDEFFAAITERPDDFHQLLVFADWLQDRDDHRAAGYRAMGELRRRPHVFHRWAYWYLLEYQMLYTIQDPESDVPEVWLNRGAGYVEFNWTRQVFNSRKCAYDSLARAWTYMTDDQRAAAADMIRTHRMWVGFDPVLRGGLKKE